MTIVNGCFFHFKQNLWKKIVVSVDRLGELRTEILNMSSTSICQ